MELGISADAAPPKIQRLSEEVVNRIAAGEIIQRPVSALKEMLENSLDAGATQINIAVKDGGNTLLQIQDNGHGIQVADLPLLCERHATSKLETFEDLSNISTLGFRGEALASISYVAHVAVTTMVAGAAHGHKVTYRDGVMDSAGPQPCAAVQGTTIAVESLFYNMPTRQRALKNASDELGRILDMVGCYAVLRPEIGFTVKKQGEARADLHCLPKSTRKENIRNLFGAEVAKNSLALHVQRQAEPDAEGESGLICEVKGFMTSADYSGKKTIAVFFINGRPVDCSPLKRAVEMTYSTLLPKHSKPFFFLDIRLPGHHVDVNLHPTKKEVGFLFQEELIGAICQAVEEKLLSSNTQRTFTQTQLPASMTNAGDLGAADEEGRVSNRREKAGGDHKLIRTDSRARTLDAYMRPAELDSPKSTLEGRAGSGGGSGLGPGLGSEGAGPPPGTATSLAAAKRKGRDRGNLGLRSQWEDEERAKSLEKSRSVRQRPNPAERSDLDSIRGLLSEIEQGCHPGLTDVIRNHTYVGLADATLALIQHGTRLYLVDTTTVTEEMFYQQAVARFEHLEGIQLSGRPSIRSIALLALKMEAAERPKSPGKNCSEEEVAELIEQLLMEKAEMLQEYLALGIDSEARLCSIPRLIDGFTPDLDYLPAFVLRLARSVDWHSEQDCFQGIAAALAEFYCLKPALFPDEAAEGVPREAADPGLGSRSSDKDGHLAARDSRREWTVEHVLYPALRAFWKPHKERVNDGSIIELTRLEHLYRIFERC